MPKYTVYQQLVPGRKQVLRSPGEYTWEANLKSLGTAHAYSGSHAIDLAKQMFPFCKNPIVEEDRPFPTEDES